MFISMRDVHDHEYERYVHARDVFVSSRSVKYHYVCILLVANGNISLYVHMYGNNSNNLLSNHRWETIHKGVGLNQHHPFSPHARCLEAGAMTDNEQLVFHDGEDSWVLDGNSKEWTKLPQGYCNCAITCSNHCVLLCCRVFSAMASLPRRKGLAILYGRDDRFDNGIVGQIISVSYCVM